MRLIIPENGAKASFRKAWAASLKGAPPGARIASLEQLALARTKVKQSQFPLNQLERPSGDGSPLWDRWMATSSCVFVGLAQSEPTLLIAHNLTPPAAKDAVEPPHFTLADDAWTLLLQPESGAWRMPLIEALPLCRGGLGTLAASAMLDHPVLRAAFGSALPAYAEAHRAIASDYLQRKLTEFDQLEGASDALRQTVADPPIVELDFGRIVQAASQVGPRGAIGWYLILDNIRQSTMEGIRHWCTCSCQLSLLAPGDNAKFLVVTE